MADTTPLTLHTAPLTQTSKRRAQNISLQPCRSNPCFVCNELGFTFRLPRRKVRTVQVSQHAAVPCDCHLSPGLFAARLTTIDSLYYSCVEVIYFVLEIDRITSVVT